MNRNELQVVKFTTRRGNQYVYDPLSNRVFFCPDLAYEILKLHESNSKDSILNALSCKYPRQEVEKWLRKVEAWINIDGAFFPTGDNLEEPACVLSEQEYWDTLMSSYVSGREMILVVTENCNLRCKYCAYGGTYKYQRTHSTRRMSSQVAKKAIDYFLDEYVAPESVGHLPVRTVIGFYGGEPLLRFDLIKYCVEYARSKENFESARCGFSITTNATLLTDEIIDYFVENEVKLSVSLNGPKEEHDRLRVYRNGGGTFDRVMANLGKVKQRHPEYYVRDVMISVIYDPRTDLRSVGEFFRSEGLPALVRCNPVDPKDTTYYEQFSDEEREAFRRTLDELKEEHFQGMIKSDLDEVPFVARRIFDLDLKSCGDRTRSNQLGFYTCTPGMKIAVYPDGSFHICEKMLPYFPIGDCDHGIMYRKVRKVMSDYYNQVIKGNCESCGARRFCGVCYASAARDGHFDSRRACERKRRDLPDFLAWNYSMIEENPNVVKEVTLPYSGQSSLLDRVY